MKGACRAGRACRTPQGLLERPDGTPSHDSKRRTAFHSKKGGLPMKHILKALVATLIMAALFFSGVLYAIYRANLEWTHDTITITAFGISWEFPCYNEPV